MEVRLSLLFPAALVVLLTLDTSGVPAWCIAASAMHEAGHFAALLALGSRPSLISVGVFGVRVVQGASSPVGYRGNILVSLAGPLVNLISYGCLLLTGAGGSVPAMVHLTLAIFNLLPVEPLDGGQALFCGLAIFLEEDRAERVTFLISMCTILPLAGAGFLLLAVSGYNFTLLAVSIYLALLILFKEKNR